MIEQESRPERLPPLSKDRVCLYLTRALHKSSEVEWHRGKLLPLVSTFMVLPVSYSYKALAILVNARERGFFIFRGVFLFLKDL